MAAGQWTGSTPFLAAPLYPYMLGVARSLGGGLHAVYILQLVMHIATAVLIAWATRLRFGAWAGLLAAALFLAMTEPAYAATRILANTLQGLLIALLWWRWIELSLSGYRWGNVVIVGGLIGLCALAWPPAMMFMPLCGLWLWLCCGRSGMGIVKGLVSIAVAALVISPATLHNLLGHGEFIPISAHDGITLMQGNGPTAIGVPSTIPGISREQSKMHKDASDLFEKVHHRRGSWREIDAYFRQQVISAWARNPRAALHLFGTKAYLYFTSQRYDDGMMPIALEREYGLADRAFLAPLPTPWLLGPAFVGAIACLCKPVKRLPEWLLFFTPLVVVIAFFYLPRYRLVGAPLFCGLAAFALTQFRTWRFPRPIVLVAFLIPVYLSIQAPPAVDHAKPLRDNFVKAMTATQTAPPKKPDPPIHGPAKEISP
jgi:hypothetical protein